MRLGISMGDPTGIGPEVVARALAKRPQQDIIVFGDRAVLDRAADIAAVAPSAHAEIVSVTRFSADQARPGHPNDVSGRAQIDYLAAATEAALEGRIAALVTAPISKIWAARGGFTFPGHTEYLAARAGVTDFAMMLAGPTLRVTLVTIHVALKTAIERLSIPSIASAVTLTARALARDFALRAPRVAVCGLNPHAGEDGHFGDEEATIVTPAIARAQAALAAEHVPATVSGPHVPDVVFRQAAAGAFDAVVALYHDQGLIPVKLLHFDKGVNVTLGLPFVRTSPDHGTAHDIAGTGRADPTSFMAALDLAVDLAQKRQAR